MEIQISREVFAKVMHWVNKSNDEVSGFGKVIWHPETEVFQVVDAYLLKQRNGAAHTDIDGQSLAKLMFTSKDQPGELKWWWHSHVNMQVFWSGTDVATIEELGGQGWIIATVFNKREEKRSALCYKAQSDLGPMVEMRDELSTYIIDTFQDKKSDWDKEYDANIEKGYVSPYKGNMASEADWRKNEYQWPDEYGQGSLLDDSDFRTRKVDDGAPNVRSISPSTNAAALEKEKAEYWTTGWWGHGAVAEAKIVGMSPSKYVNTLLYGTVGEIGKIDAALELAIEKGELV